MRKSVKQAAGREAEELPSEWGKPLQLAPSSGGGTEVQAAGVQEIQYILFIVYGIGWRRRKG